MSAKRPKNLAFFNVIFRFMWMEIDSVKMTQFIVEASQNFSISQTKTFELESGNVVV